MESDSDWLNLNSDADNGADAGSNSEASRPSDRAADSHAGNQMNTGNQTNTENTVDHFNRIAEYVAPSFQALLELIQQARDRQAAMTSTVGFVGSHRRQGTSTVARHAAIYAAQILDINTLLVDANFRSPSVQSVFHVEAPTGLSDSIKDHDEIEVATKPIESTNLSVMTCGDASLKRTARLEAKISSTIAELLEHHQLVIFDLPDSQSQVARMFSGLLDQVFLVSNPVQTSAAKIRIAKTWLEKRKVKLSGLFLNEHHP